MGQDHESGREWGKITRVGENGARSREWERMGQDHESGREWGKITRVGENGARSRE